MTRQFIIHHKANKIIFVLINVYASYYRFHCYQNRRHLRLFPDITCGRFQGLLALVALTLFSCAPAKYVPQGEHLLSKNKVETVQKSVTEDQLKGYIIQRPNKKLLGFRFYLFLYNLSNIEKEKWPHNWLRKIGEEPVIYDPGLTVSSSGQLRQFLENKGYYHAVVNDTVLFKGRNAYVNYTIRPNDPYRVNSIAYIFEDTGLISLVLPDTLNSLLKRGMRFDKDVLQQEPSILQCDLVMSVLRMWRSGIP